MIDESGNYRLGDYNLLLQGYNIYYRLLSRTTENCYLSPKLINSLDKGVLKPKHDIFKSDTFSLGMTLLEVATLKPAKACYDLNLFQLKEDEIESRIQEVRQRYS